MVVEIRDVEVECKNRRGMERGLKDMLERK